MIVVDHDFGERRSMGSMNFRLAKAGGRDAVFDSYMEAERFRRGVKMRSPRISTRLIHNSGRGPLHWAVYVR